MAAYRAGVKMVLIPHENLKDLEEVDEVILKRIEINPVQDATEVICAALVCEPPMIAETQIENAVPVHQSGMANAYRGS